MHFLTSPWLRGQKPSAFQRNNDVILKSEASPDRYKKSPFFDDADMEVIAVFTLDHKILNRKSRLLFCYWALFAFMLCLSHIILLLSLPQHLFRFFAIYMGIFLLVFFPIKFHEEREERLRRERSIFKITRRGIYLDEVDAPGSTVLRHRTVFRFNDIKSCSLEQADPLGLIISQVIVRGNNGKPMLKIYGLVAAQEFVETVNRYLTENQWQRGFESSFAKLFLV